MRCGGEPRARVRQGNEPLIKETTRLTKLAWGLAAACAVGALLLYSAFGDAPEASGTERGLLVEAAETPPPAAPAPALAHNEAAARAQRDEEQARDQAATRAAAVRVARARVPIVMYSTSWCGVCRSARAYLDAHNIRFTEYDVETNEAARAEYSQLNPRRTVPTFDIGGEVLSGFSEESFEAALDTAAARRVP